MTNWNLQEVLAAAVSQERELFAIVGAIVLAALIAGTIFWLLTMRVAGLHAGRPAEREAAECGAGAYGFPVVTEAGTPREPREGGPQRPLPVQDIGRGPGRYRIVGVVAATGTDIRMYVDAETPANAKVKAELKGVVVTEVEKQ